MGSPVSPVAWWREFLRADGPADAPPPRELRSALRKPTRSAAWIGYGASPSPIPCVVWDLSVGGARLTAAHIRVLPDRFTLLLTRDGKVRRMCRIAWRTKSQIGVQFLRPLDPEALYLRSYPAICDALARTENADPAG